MSGTGKTRITIRLSNDVISWFKLNYPDGYQTAIDSVLRLYVEGHSMKSDLVEAVKQAVRDECKNKKG